MCECEKDVRRDAQRDAWKNTRRKTRKDTLVERHSDRRSQKAIFGEWLMERFWVPLAGDKQKIKKTIFRNEFAENFPTVSPSLLR